MGKWRQGLMWGCLIILKCFKIASNRTGTKTKPASNPPQQGGIRRQKKLIMEYKCVYARFKFFNGDKVYTVQYNYGIHTWYVLQDEETTAALWSKQIDPNYQKSPNRAEAEIILEEYLNLEECLNKNSHVHPIFKSILDKI